MNFHELLNCTRLLAFVGALMLSVLITPGCEKDGAKQAFRQTAGNLGSASAEGERILQSTENSSQSEDSPGDEYISSKEFVKRLSRLQYDELVKEVDYLREEKDVESLKPEYGEAEIVLRTRRGYNERKTIQAITSVSSEVFPGKIISGKELRVNRNVRGITSSRSSLRDRQVTISSLAYDQEIPKFNPTDSEKFNRKVLTPIRQKKINLGTNINYEYSEANSSGSFELRLGTSLGIFGIGANAFAQASSKKDRTVIYACWKEPHFTLSLADNIPLEDWFEVNVSKDMADVWLGDLPVFVEKVTYGKLVLVVVSFDADLSMEEAGLAVSFIGNSGGIDAKNASLLRHAKMWSFVYGAENGLMESVKESGSEIQNFRVNVAGYLKPSVTTEFSQPIGFSAATFEAMPRQAALLVASDDQSEIHAIPTPYKVQIRPIHMIIGHASYDPFHEQGDFHAAVKIDDNLYQSGLIIVKVPEADRDKKEYDVPGFGGHEIAMNEFWTIPKRSGKISVILGESDSGPDAKEIDVKSWPEKNRWSKDGTSIIDKEFNYDLKEILEDNRSEILIKGEKFRYKEYVAECKCDNGLRNQFKFQLLVSVPGISTTRQEDLR